METAKSSDAKYKSATAKSYSSKYIPPHKRNHGHANRQVWQPKKSPLPVRKHAKPNKINTSNINTTFFVFSDDGSIDLLDECSPLKKVASSGPRRNRGPSYLRRQERRKQARDRAAVDEAVSRPDESDVNVRENRSVTQPASPVQPTEEHREDGRKLEVLFSLAALLRDEDKLSTSVAELEKKVERLNENIETLKRLRIDIEQDVEFSVMKVNGFMSSLESGDWTQADVDKKLSKELRLLIKEYKEHQTDWNLSRILGLLAEAAKIGAPLFREVLTLQRDNVRHGLRYRLFTACARSVPIVGRFM